MPTFELSDDEIEILRDIFAAYDLRDCDSFKALGVKLGVWEAEKPLTAEELKRREEFADSQLGQHLRKMMTYHNKHLERIARQGMVDGEFFSGDQWPVGTELRIRLPNDYQVKDKK